MNENKNFDEIRTSDNAVSSRSDSALLLSELTRWRQNLGCLSLLAAVPAVASAGGEKISLSDVGTEVAGGPVRPAAERRSLQPGKFFARRDNYLLRHQAGRTDLVSEFTGNDDCPGAQIPNGTYTAAVPFSDTGDTTGANNTINTIYCYYCYLGASNGPDHVYTFTLTSTGAAPEIRVTPTSGSFNPLIYILADNLAPCGPTSGSQPAFIWLGSDARGAGEAETVGADAVRSLPLNVPLHLFVDSRSPTANFAGAYTLRMQDVTIAPGPRTKFDFDRDGKADISVFRPSEGTWYTNRGPVGSDPQFSSVQFGISTDDLVPADYDGDGKTDVAVFRDGIWYWINSSNSSMVGLQFGLSGDIPQPADFDGDGRSEIVVFRAGIWHTYNLRTGEVVTQPFGIPGDKPVVGDYDGDGRADYAVYRNGTWFLLRSVRGFIAIPFGLANDVPVPANYTLFGNRTHIGVFRNGTWHLLLLFGDVPQSWFNFQFPFGQAGDIPVPGDYDGIGVSQPAVFRNGIWYVGNLDGRLVTTHPFGIASDKPVPAAFQQR